MISYQSLLLSTIVLNDSRNIGYRDLMICNLCVSNFMSRYSDILYNTVNP